VRRGQATGLTAVGFGGLGALLGISLPSMAGTFFFQAILAGHFWMVMGLLARAECLCRPEQESAPALNATAS
jgi:hypothetical protein